MANHEHAYAICENKCLVEVKKVGFTGDYDDLNNKPSIPDAYSKSEIDSKLAGKADKTELNTKADKTELNTKADKITRTSTDSTSLTLAPNSSTVVTGTPTALNLTLSAPASGIDSEYRITFKAGANFALTVTCSGYSIKWAEDPEWTANHVYELSFADIGTGNVIGAVVKEYEV